MQVWLIEINHMPSFKGDSTLDAQIKNGVIRGALKRLKVQYSDWRLSIQQYTKTDRAQTDAVN